MRRIPLGALVPTVLAGGAQTYSEKVLALGPIAYYKLDETSGTTATDSSGNGYNGTFARDVSTMGTGVGPLGGDTAPAFDGTNDVVVLPAASLDAKWNGSLFTISAWCIVSGVGVWTDGAWGRVVSLRVNVSNLVYLMKSVSNNRWDSQFNGGGTLDTVTYSTSTTSWFHSCLVVNRAADTYKLFINGAQTGSTQTGIGTWAGSLLANYCCIGAYVNTPTEAFSGRIAQVAIFASDQEANVATLANV